MKLPANTYSTIRVEDQEYVEITVYSRKHGDTRIKIDPAMQDKVAMYNWHLELKHGRLHAKSPGVGLMARYICPGDKPLKHINEDTLDNRLANLQPMDRGGMASNPRDRGWFRDEDTGAYRARDCPDGEEPEYLGDNLTEKQAREIYIRKMQERKRGK